jgi:hypothetical protein
MRCHVKSSSSVTPHYADVTLNCCERKIISLWGLHKHGGTPALRLQTRFFWAKKNLRRLAAGFYEKGLEILKKFHGEKSELMM